MADNPMGATPAGTRPEAVRHGEREAVERLELLAVISTALSRAMEDYSSAVRQVAEACVPDFCDLCAIELIGESGESETVAYRVASSASLTAPASWTPIGGTIAPSRAATLCYERPDEPATTRHVRQRLGAQSLIAAPIVGGGLTLGWLVMAVGQSRRGLRPSALRVAQDIGARLATCIQRVMLYRESVAAGHQQARAARRLRRLAAAAANLAGADTPAEVLRLACVEICIVLDGDAAAARWSLNNAPDIEASVGVSDPSLAAGALEAAMYGASTRGPGWIAASLPCADPQQSAALAVFSDKHISADDELLLTSLASMVPVAFERAMNTEQALLREAELDAVLEASPVAIVTMGADGAVTGANRAAQDLFGWRAGAEGLEFPPSIRPAMLQLPLDVRTSGSVSNRLVAAEGFDLSVSAAPMPASTHEQPGLLVVASDVREQREVERALLQAQRLEAMGQVAGGIAHDFNNLLTVMIGYTSILQRSLQQPDQAALLGNIETAVNRAAALTQQLLGFTRRQMEDVVVVDLAQSVRSLHPVLDRLVGPAITVDLQLPGAPVHIAADPSAVEQMILNLSINARDAMEDGGKLTISVDEVDLDPSHASELEVRPGHFARLVVADNGPGMSEEVRSRCLEPFFTTKERGKGTGLGLPTVYGQTVERGGAVIIDTAPGEGTAVGVWLPRAEAGATPASGPAPGADVPALAGRALLVEDQDDLRRLAGMTLRDAGMEVVDAGDAETALLMADEATWDVLVTDIVLPGMTGVELATRLRSLHPRLPVLYVSGYADRDTRRRGLVEGSRLLRKPYRPDELCRRVAELVCDAGSEQGGGDD